MPDVVLIRQVDLSDPRSVAAFFEEQKREAMVADDPKSENPAAQDAG